jgi:hypothetical protein
MTQKECKRMAESGHVVNLNNLKKARDFATGWGAAYQPSNPDLDIAAMSAEVPPAVMTG